MKWIYIVFIALLFPTIINSSTSENYEVDWTYNHLSAYEEIQIKLVEYEEELQRQLWIQEIERFLKDIGHRESGNNWKRWNKYGYIGKYQFGHAARKATGYGHIHYWAWRKNPHIWNEQAQDTAMVRYMKYNYNELISIIQDIDTLPLFLDKDEITMSGVLAAAHLAGSGNVKKFFAKRGRYNPKDAYGTRLSDYLKDFSGYDFNLNII